MALNYHEIINYFVENEPEIMFFDKRVSFNGKPSSFGSCYVCRNFLTQKIICHSLPHNNTGKNFIGSRMMNLQIKTYPFNPQPIQLKVSFKGLNK
jgi:hypothetical protein